MHAPGAGHVIDSIIVLARGFGMEIVAEGVETLAQAQWLQARGVDYAQGWLFSPAVPVKEAEAMLRERWPWRFDRRSAPGA